MHHTMTRRAEGIGGTTLSIATVAALFRQLHLDLIILDQHLEALIATHRGVDVLERFPRARRRELAAKVAVAASEHELVALHLDEERHSGVELGAFALDGGMAVVVAGPGSQRSPAPNGLRRLYGLTPAEARVARALSSGRSPKQIAVELEVELSTVRTHLRALHGKLGAASQGDLIRRLLTSIATFMHDTAEGGCDRKSDLLDSCDDAASASSD